MTLKLKIFHFNLKYYVRKKRKKDGSLFAGLKNRNKGRQRKICYNHCKLFKSIMNYELAKKLEVAGFYQPKGKDIFKGEYLYINPKCFKSAVYNPTLEELIDACGGKARVLMTKGEGDGWAYAVDGNGASGKTPIEAVANLWLKLIK